jgi:1-deoxy-D-xylulose-5-phosphate reductoisomerase
MCLIIAGKYRWPQLDNYCKIEGDMTGPVKKLAVLGSTGSVGKQTLDVVRAWPQRFRIVGLAAGRNLDLIAEQIKEFKPQLVGYATADNHDKLGKIVDIKYDLLSVEDMARHPDVDLVVMAMSGRAGLVPTLAAIGASKTIALANKESLVMAGDIITKEAKRSGARILPVDSEHSAIWQCLHGEKQEAVRIILTASGGPFRTHSPGQLEKVTVTEALRHPSWHMGKKVTIDSATMMNKGLEVIEAHWLFNIPFDSIEVVVHPQSIIHSMVEFADGSIKAQLSCPDMRLPIQYALTYPDRLYNPRLPRVDWEQVRRLDFAAPDMERFPCLRLATEAGKRSGTSPGALCAADEVAVELFLDERIRFIDIPYFIEKVLNEHKAIASPSLEEIIETDAWAREALIDMVNGEERCY